jgi:hypothetical protein
MRQSCVICPVIKSQLLLDCQATNLDTYECCDIVKALKAGVKFTRDDVENACANIIEWSQQELVNHGVQKGSNQKLSLLQRFGIDEADTWLEDTDRYTRKLFADKADVISDMIAAYFQELGDNGLKLNLALKLNDLRATFVDFLYLFFYMGYLKRAVQDKVKKYV